jgi:aminomethyltransferase
VGDAKKTPLHGLHVEAGAKMVEFAGYDMPVRYTSDKAEHMAVREQCGLFDVSHMGEVFLEGKDAVACAQRLFSNDFSKVEAGGSMYTGMLNDKGGFVDDCIVYRFSDEKVLVCVNASNRDKDYAHIAKVAEGFDVTATDDSDSWVQIAVQGPNARALVAELVDDVMDIAPFCFAERDVTGGAGIVARTGYTGEDGFELYVPAASGPDLWRALVEKGEAHGRALCGLGARDTLRLEAALRLYGNDIDDEHTPLEAGLSWTVKIDKGDFIGRDALIAQKESGIPRRMRGVEMEGRGIPRHGYKILSTDGAEIGVVTSGTQAPFLGRPIALAYVDAAHAAFGSEVAVEIRGKPVPAKLAKLPFYKRA